MSVLIVRSAWVLATALLVAGDPRLEQFERLDRYGYGHFEMRGDEQGREGLHLRVNAKSARGIALAIVKGDKRRSDVVAYFEAHPLEARAWDAVSQCFSDPNCRRTRYITRAPGGPKVRTKIGGPADIFHSPRAAAELDLASRWGVSGPAIEMVQRTGLHLADVMKLYKRGFKTQEQAGVKIHDEALAVVVRGVENGEPFRLGGAEIHFWRSQSYLAMYVTSDPDFDVPAFWSLLESIDPNVQRELHPYFDVTEEASRPAAEEATSDAIGIPNETGEIVAYFAGVWDVHVMQGGKEFRAIEYHGSLGAAWDIADFVVDGEFVSHSVRGVGATGLFEETQYLSRGGAPQTAVGRYDAETRTLVLDNPTSSKQVVFESADAFTTRVFARTSDGRLELDAVLHHERRPVEDLEGEGGDGEPADRDEKPEGS